MASGNYYTMFTYCISERCKCTRDTQRDLAQTQEGLYLPQCFLYVAPLWSQTTEEVQPKFGVYICTMSVTTILRVKMNVMWHETSYISQSWTLFIVPCLRHYALIAPFTVDTSPYEWRHRNVEKKLLVHLLYYVYCIFVPMMISRLSFTIDRIRK